MRRRRNITVVHNEINYDKLAEAIARANSKQQEKYSTSREWMKYILIFAFWSIAILSGILAIAMLISLCQNATAVFENGTLTENLIFTLKFLTTLFTIGFCIFSIFTATEIEKENDRTYIASIFSNIAAIAALVVAIAALLKGVG